MSFDATPPARWRRSTRCGASNGCVEIARIDGEVISVRDSHGANEGAAYRLEFGPGEWRAFTDEVKGGRHDRP
ncbi:DUF397 domain-containing protein [Actinomadura rubrisoli]|uniref:DUF397 domain-containing protein n=2 Tax=Actinomadura rubrisoli TaxID=2530368 RepID=A0A4R5C9U7_9ACTN|nr:DUF397 domain-containing protein [Actinomadura rubrisoli]TDD94973.1 DUF397 domain-containing protein [Actinomadura rubrisoli]